MRVILRVCILIIILIGTLHLWADDALDYIRRMEEIMNPDDSVMSLSIRTREPGRKERVLQLTVQYRRNVGTLMEMTSPARSKGIRFLQRDNALWMYNPRSAAAGPLRLSPRDSFQGTVFSNSDIGDPNFSGNYESRIITYEMYYHQELGEVETAVIESHASNQEAPYGRIMLRVTSRESLPLEVSYFARSGLLFKRMEFSGFQELAGTLRPALYSMESLERSETVSVIEISDLRIDHSMSDRVFTIEYLTR